MQINADFECGNIVVEQAGETEATLKIRPDSQAAFYQWFYFQVSGEPDVLREFQITNAGQSSYPNAWIGYRALASYDGTDWFRVHTQYDGHKLTIKHRATEPITSYAFFVPYTQAMREQLLRDCGGAAERRNVVTTPGGRPVDLVVFGSKQPKKKVWIISRQHAGEPMAEWCIEGMIRRLLDRDSWVTKAFLNSDIALYFIPNMNPDGSALGNLRANANGVDLNRVWLNPPETAPEVKAVRALMESEGVDFFLDIHGDEERPYIWLVQPHPDNVAPEVEDIQQRFEAEIRSRHIEYGPKPLIMPSPTNPESGMSIDYIAPRFKCPAFIIELPFKDIIGDNRQYDSLLAEGCEGFGRSCLAVVHSLML
jgi:murein tripeptide amidase MpaA